ncbi:RxLR effector protein [Phytophthora megakarya]|uniref:RxLR effector protein n=1 Tax=Phytophthora megakarya TaxID=4795 RepID=A0A225VRJ4_9STRA|nr:RxLR effector protein [Phytophthora megakarya]
MRVTIVVLAAIALSINCAAATTKETSMSAKLITNLVQDVSAVTSPGLVRSLETADGDVTERRFLRSHTENNVDEDDIEDEGEERASGANLFATNKLDQMMNSIKTFKRFKNWKVYGYTPTDVYTKMWNEGLYEKYKSLYTMYNNNYHTI